MKLEYKEIAKKSGVIYKEFSKSHVRFTGGITVDFWPTTNRAWIMGTDKSFKINRSEEIIAVANQELFPEGVKWYTTNQKYKEMAEQGFINIENCCFFCRKSILGENKKNESFNKKSLQS